MAKVVWFSGLESRAYRLDDFSPGGHNTQRRQRAPIDDSLTIHQHLIFGVTTVDHIDIDSEVFSDLRCRTDSVKS